ncbi:hypothetical protein [Dongshaea marina]|uniref:hypothetical protein n=1 Tax=Dongshaea marina TaxID=2047966 RepID=UPI000D3E6658|nr:hypothetical protein [Dongshaea marina]
MLQFTSRKTKEGVILWANEELLLSLYHFVLDVTRQSMMLRDDGQCEKLASEIKTAYNGLSHKKTVRKGKDRVTLLGFELNWVQFIAQLALLRTALSYMDSSKKEQYHMFLLEDLLEQALNCNFPREAPLILATYHTFLLGHSEAELNGQDSINRCISIYLATPSSERRTKLAPLLGTLCPHLHNEQFSATFRTHLEAAQTA